MFLMRLTHRHRQTLSQHLTAAHILLCSQQMLYTSSETVVSNIITLCFKWMYIGGTIQISRLPPFVFFHCMLPPPTLTFALVSIPEWEGSSSGRASGKIEEGAEEAGEPQCPEHRGFWRACKRDFPFVKKTSKVWIPNYDLVPL